MSANTQLRNRIRKQRLALNADQQSQAAQKLLMLISQSVLFRQSSKIAFYKANGGEIDPAPLLEQAWQQDKACYLPVVDGAGMNQLYFAPVERNSEFIRNRYQIDEPVHRAEQLCPAQQLDLVLVPLVAADSSGNRLGMGKGYYDRTFAFMLNREATEIPFLLGLAHDFQIIDRIKCNHWDVPLNGLATGDRLIFF